jgi:predicted transcriptional regulator
MSISETPLARISVADSMHTGILMTDPDTPLRLVARLMSERRVHVVAVAEDGQMRRPLRMISTLDIAGAVASCTSGELTAGQVAQTELRAVRAGDSVETAARLMAEHRVEHLVVIDPASGHAEGIISALDVAAVLGR